MVVVAHGGEAVVDGGGAKRREIKLLVVCGVFGVLLGFGEACVIIGYGKGHLVLFFFFVGLT